MQPLSKTFHGQASLQGPTSQAQVLTRTEKVQSRTSRRRLLLLGLATVRGRSPSFVSRSKSYFSCVCITYLQLFLCQECSVTYSTVGVSRSEDRSRTMFRYRRAGHKLHCFIYGDKVDHNLHVRAVRGLLGVVRDTGTNGVATNLGRSRPRVAQLGTARHDNKREVQDSSALRSSHVTRVVHCRDTKRRNKVVQVGDLVNNGQRRRRKEIHLRHAIRHTSFHAIRHNNNVGGTINNRVNITHRQARAEVILSNTTCAQVHRTLGRHLNVINVTIHVGAGVAVRYTSQTVKDPVCHCHTRRQHRVGVSTNQLRLKAPCNDQLP